MNVNWILKINTALDDTSMDTVNKLCIGRNKVESKMMLIKGLSFTMSQIQTLHCNLDYLEVIFPKSGARNCIILFFR